MDAVRPLLSRMRGFSLLEIVIGMIVLGVLGIVGAKMISGSVLTNQVISNEHLAYSSARYALERMSREIREINYDISTGTIGIANPATNMTNSRLEFTQSGLLSTKLVTLIYTPPNGSIPGSISLAYNGDTQTLLNNLSAASVVFSYFQNDGITAVTAATVDTLRYVRIDLSVKPDTSKNEVLTLSNLVTVRNK